MSSFGLFVVFLLSGVVKGKNTCLDLDSPNYKCSEGAIELSTGACEIADDDLEDLANCFDRAGRGSIYALNLTSNSFTYLPARLFDGFAKLEHLSLIDNDLTTLPAKLFEGMDNLYALYLQGNPGLQCIPTNEAAFILIDTIMSDQCECTPPGALMCDDGFKCAPGEHGYTCEMSMHKPGGELDQSDIHSTDVV